MTTLLLLLCDIFVLKSGGKLDGIERARAAGKVTIEVGAGLVTIEEKEIAEVRPGKSKVAEYYERAEALKDSKDAGALGALASWAKSNGMSRFATELFGRILAIDPQHEAAHRGLGHERVGEQWMTKDDAMRARGFVEFEGRWVAPEERDLVLAARELKRREAAAAAKAKRAAAEAKREAEREVVVLVPERERCWGPCCRRWWPDYAWWHPKVAPGAVAAPSIVFPAKPAFYGWGNPWPNPGPSVYKVSGK